LPINNLRATDNNTTERLVHPEFGVDESVLRVPCLILSFSGVAQERAPCAAAIFAWISEDSLHETTPIRDFRHLTLLVALPLSSRRLKHRSEVRCNFQVIYKILFSPVPVLIGLSAQDR
jgi:hypothetical protein